MIRFLFIHFLVLLSHIFCFGQENKITIDTLNIYFDINEFTLSLESKEMIDSVLLEIKNNTSDTVKLTINGYTDIDGNDKYNLSLAKKRIKSVKELFIEKKFLHIQLEEPYAKYGVRKREKYLNRRVELIYSYYSVNNELDLDEDILIQKKEKVYKDSVIVYPNGLEVLLKKDLVAALDTTDSFGRFEIVDKSLNAGNNLNGYTQDENGNPLASGGMFDIYLENKFGQDTCLREPIIVRFPVKDEGCYRSPYMLPWEQNEDGTWKESDDFVIRTITIDGKDYYEAELTCPGKRNMDAKLSRFKLKVKPLKVPKALMLDSIVLSNKCETIRLRGVSKNHKNIKIVVPCGFQNLSIEYYFHSTKSNEVIQTEPILLGKHKAGLGYRFCKVEKGRTGKFRSVIFWPRLHKYKVAFSDLEVIGGHSDK